MNSFAVVAKRPGVKTGPSGRKPTGPGPRDLGDALDTLGEPGRDALVEHRLAGHRADGFAQRVLQAVALREEQQAGLGAELARAKRERPGVGLRDGLAAAATAPG